VDPDSEIITNTTVTAGNAGDASVAEDLISDLLAEHRSSGQTATAGTDTTGTDTTGTDTTGTDTTGTDTTGTEAKQDERATGGADTPRVYGDNAYGTGGFHDQLERAGIEDRCKTQQPVAAGGMFTKDRFAINLHADKGALSRRAHRPDPAPQQRGRHRQLLALLHTLPAAPAVHHRARRTHRHRRRL
jgi:hypothetical protein